MTQPTPAALALLRQLRESYLQDLPEKLDRLEGLLLAAGKTTDADGERFADFYRQVHSLKGSGGTYGLHVLSTVCHQLEDYLNLRAGNPPRLEAALAAPALRHVDLLRLVASEAVAGQISFETVERKLAALRTELFPRTLKALVVLSSRTTRQLCVQLLEARGFRALSEADSYTALLRALTEPFDVLITSNELPVLSGAGLLAAIRLSNHPNRSTPSILITSSADQRGTRRQIDPDHVLVRDPQLPDHLDRLLNTIQIQYATVPGAER